MQMDVLQARREVRAAVGIAPDALSRVGTDALDVLAARTIEHLVPDLFEWTGDADGNGRLGQDMRGMTEAQGGAVAGFLLAMQEAHGTDFPQDTSPA